MDSKLRSTFTSSQDQLDPNEIICVCRGITRGQIQATIQINGITCVAGLTQQLGAGSECRSCTSALSELLGDSSAWTEVDSELHLLSADPMDPARIVQVDFHVPMHTTYPESFAGQHITVQGLIDGRWVSRTYTIINPGAGTDVVSVAVRRVPTGQFTPWLLHDDGTPKRLRISVPLGDNYWAKTPQHTVCMVGGIGITLAKSLLAQLPTALCFHLEYSARAKIDQVFMDDFKALSEQHQGFTLNCRTDDADGYLNKDVVTTIARFPSANYVLCGPPTYVRKVYAWLQEIGISARNIHVEKFFLPEVKKRTHRSWKWYGYRAGAVVALLPALWLAPGLQDSVPHHQHNLGHERLECSDCHRSAPGTLRQQLQAKVDFWLGRREVNAAFAFEAVDNRACLYCHQRAQDQHPAHRFLEPRFAEVRATLGPQRCVSCHREHQQVRVTLADIGYCVACHKELEVKKDRIAPTHTELIKASRWETCLGCHDFHNNHAWKVPEKLSEAIGPDRIRDYFATGKSPYGEVREKAKTKLPTAATKN